jgi:excisionase family DNA binding protein
MAGTSPAITALAAQFAQQIIAAVQNDHQARAVASPGPERRLFTAEQAGVYIGRTESAVRHLIHQRDIPVVRIGRSVHIDRKDLDTWIENNRC